MRYTLSLNYEHYLELKNHLINDDGLERVAYLICGRSFIKKDIWDGGSEERFLSRGVVIVPEDEIISSEKYKVNWSTKSFISTLKKADEKNFAIALVHNHPSGVNSFSPVDDDNEPHLFKLAFNRNGGDRPHLSIIMTPDGNLIGRVWDSDLQNYELDFIRILGDKFKFLYQMQNQYTAPDIFHRQQLAFGTALNQDLSMLRIGIVGCGATGSATSMLLVRLGVGQILLIDNDIVERTNLNRLHGATSADADAGKPKVEVVGEALSNIGLGTRVRYIQDWAGSDRCKDALKSCDLIFGCTDDNAGRLILNRLAYFYLIPIIDMGLAIKVSNTEPPEIEVLNGRVTVIFPKNTCLLCREVINVKKAYEENLKREDILGYERLKKEAYVLGEMNPSPAIVTFTTEISTVAVNELIHRIQGFRTNTIVNNRIRFFHRDMDLKTDGKCREGCDICDKSSYWGRGDMKPFLNIT